jgi:hypothetical protein
MKLENSMLARPWQCELDWHDKHHGETPDDLEHSDSR